MIIYIFCENIFLYNNQFVCINTNAYLLQLSPLQLNSYSQCIEIIIPLHHQSIKKTCQKYYACTYFCVLHEVLSISTEQKPIFRAVGTGRGEANTLPPDFDRSVNPIPTWGRLCPPHYLLPHPNL